MFSYRNHKYRKPEWSDILKILDLSKLGLLIKFWTRVRTWTNFVYVVQARGTFCLRDSGRVRAGHRKNNMLQLSVLFNILRLLKLGFSAYSIMIVWRQPKISSNSWGSISVITSRRRFFNLPNVAGSFSSCSHLILHKCSSLSKFPIESANSAILL